ncbi:TIGR03757 family integrating conjugative element protein [Pectobacterium brasiliense]|nr:MULTISPECIES: TIGR03757 family integrating conjugative element protein [Pectobacterium]MCY9847545.1 TIGR03757 family integrating conjugative element protein [Pectobacterium jejuense]MDG0800984.1 TIGR03757 family integrating conjugative element protein [Pectobacterium polaris]MDY4325175.1 TIGR03757 family integrating conjugative element protein [Pectobacterium brasiliense]UVD99510.1 TIGR03757 family integrating conjugative element protein [Pectobacterium parvum]WGL30178.1 TIGR03757 family in
MLTALLSPLAQAADVVVVTDTRHPVQNLGNTRLIELDGPSRIEAELAASLPQDPARAAIIVQQRLREGGTALQQRINEAYQDVVDAWSLGITTLPAVIVDQRYVVYGEPDVAKAVARINTYRRAQP